MTASCIPSRLVAGDGWSWAVPEAAYHPAPDWSLVVLLRPVAGGAAVTLVGLWGDGAWSVGLAPALSAAVVPGDYTWAALATDPAARATLAQGRVTVAPDPAAASGDTRNSAERILAAIEATIAGRATKDADSYSIEGRSLSRTPIADLLRLRSLYRAEVAQERDPGRGPITYRRIGM